MTVDPDSLRAGELFEWHAVVAGVRIELLTEVEVDGTTIHLRDVAIYPVGVWHADVGAGPLLRAARADLFPGIRAAGFTLLPVTAIRLSGARRGRIVDLTIDLERHPMIAPVTERAATLWQAGERWDAILGALRAEGFSKVDCIKATVDQLRLPLGDAKRIVHDSAAWADVRDRDDEWQERLVSEVEAGARPA